MKLHHQLTRAFTLVALGLFASVTVAAASSVNASYNLNMLTFQPRANSTNSSAVAMVEHEDGRELLDGFKVWASLFVQTEIGAFHMYSNLTGAKGGSATCELTGKFNDTVTVNTKTGSSLLSGMLHLSGQVHRQVFGNGSMHGGDVSLTITIHNYGSTAHPKNIDTTLTYFEGWGDSQIDLAPLVAQNVMVDKFDRLQITAVQTIRAHAITDGVYSYVFDIANFHETSNFYIDALTSDFIVTSESGHDYSSPKSAVESKTWFFYE